MMRVQTKSSELELQSVGTIWLLVGWGFLFRQKRRINTNGPQTFGQA